ncbi:MAG TPA: NAD(P)H-dependent oxidoreductase subunit E, partial [Bacteroidales bacterium]|nr:NAD(P)H-dependent oxidoreductase subunit E [Bacteroidales bacterium]
MSKNLRGLSGRKGLENSLYEEIISSGAGGSDERGEKLKAAAETFLVGKSLVLGVNSFYDFLTTEHSRKKVFICDGTACLTSGRQEELKRSLLERYTDDEIGTVSCLGHCHSNNAYMADHAVYTSDDHQKAAKKIYTGTNAERPALLAQTGELIEYYLLIKGFSERGKVLKEIELSGLRGRGGAGFPFHLKLKSTLEAKSDKKYVVCNADEGDPGAFSDKWLLEERPHSVLFGMLMAGLITGADEGVIYIRGEYPEAVNIVKKAVQQLEDENIVMKLLPGRKFRFYVIEGSGAYICGEETSLLNSLEGLRPEVRTRPPFPAVYGLFGKPTVLSNVETFANVRYILKEGGAAYSAMGTEKSPGTKLVSLDSAFNRPGLYEVKMGTPLKQVLNGLGGGTRYPV